jgi:hypothetical protein
LFGAVLLAIVLVLGHLLVPLFMIGPWCIVAANATYRLARRIVPDQNAIDK